ncbi:oxaloacetate decarboxylase [Marinibaculum pumilum]|uniref:Oxaloacetate decarboxylase n=1 Tax=Marinibaculum pumilum TaxID=1766165 RepID=A0ABV7KYU8_9PROT
MSGDFKARLAGGDIVVAPGIYDALGAMLAEQAGFEALYLSGASLTYTRLGRPDLGLIDRGEIADAISMIRERCDLPLIVDGEAGFGNALNVQREVRSFEAAGATVIQIEDQDLPKRCGHLDGKTLVPAGEMAGKIRAAVDARRNAGTLIMARTDAVAVEGTEAALDRAEQYLEAGADLLFVEALRTEAEMQAACTRFAGRVPLLANMVEGGKTPFLPADRLQALGFSIAIFPGGLVRALAKAAQDYFAVLKAHGTTAPHAGRMLDFAGLNGLLGTARILEEAKRYDSRD